MLSKDPANRPANADRLAEAADAIRSGDIRAAHAAVPGMLLFEAATGPITAPVDVQATAATSVVGALPYESSAPATSALPSLSRSESLAAERSWIEEDEEEEPPAEPPAKRRRSPWTWPLIALILLLLFVIGAILLQQLGVFSQKPAPSTSSVSTPASSAAVTTSATSPSGHHGDHPSTPPPTTAAPEHGDTVPGPLQGPALLRCPGRADQSGDAGHGQPGGGQQPEEYRAGHRSVRTRSGGEQHHRDLFQGSRIWFRSRPFLLRAPPMPPIRHLPLRVWSPVANHRLPATACRPVKLSVSIPGAVTPW